MDGEKERVISISVRNLVEFVLRSGDLDNRRTSGAERDAMQAGSRIHRKIQKRMGSAYQAEVKLSCRIEEEEFVFQVEGRADGILTEVSGVTIDEIKGVYRNLSHIEKPEPVHMAQAMCYAYFYSKDKELETIGIQVTYCNLETEEIRRFREEKSAEELETWFRGLIHEYVKWARYLYHHEIRRQESIKDLPFPYAYREGQKELAVAVYRSLARKRNLYIQAPTGIGKTLSVIYPALKAIGEGLGDKLFYLTAKTITRTVAEETFELLRRQGLYFTSVTITAKEKLCFLGKPDCNPEACPYARGHFDRVNDAVYEMIHKEQQITREVILSYAENHQVCPFEFCLDITSWADGIICDYNYVFDPNVRLKRYFGEKTKGEYLFLIDEAHNLVGRAREMYSAALIKEDILMAKRRIKGKNPKLEKALDRCNRVMLEMKRDCEDYQVLDQIHGLILPVMSVYGEMEEFLNENPVFPDREQLLDFYFQLRDFVMVHELADERYRIYSELREDGTFLVRMLCVDPSANLSACLEQGNGAVFFSATLLPVNYYKELISGNREEYAVYAHSPFDPANRLLLVAPDVSSRYTRRNQREYEKIGEYIRIFARARQGNYMVFLPSYRYMDHIREILEKDPEFECICQKSRMDEREKEEFLEKFEEERDRSLIALCVMGGIFSEGIDLKAERLIGAVVVGTGLPQICVEQEILKDYFDEKGKSGFAFAYQYPGMNKVLQSAGRVIRTMEDQGVIALLDDRFLSPDCLELFPREWRDYETVTLDTVERRVREFWADHPAFP